ncbi:MAG: FkbM family methyltransferase [Phycisphaerales bacterium]
MQGFFPQPPPDNTAIRQLQQQLQQLAGQTSQSLQQFQKQFMDTRKRIYALEAKDRLRDSGRSPRLPVEFRGQFGEDLLLYDMLGEKPDGLLIEVGAFDGRDLSVTYAMDAIGWNCLLIEAIPDRFAQCKANRPHARVIHAALAQPGAPSEAEFTITEDHWGGMLSYLNTSKEHAQAVDSQKMRTSKVRVPCTTMNELLKDHTGDIAAASIDVEGGEVQLLQGFDLNKFRPRILLIEDQTQQDEGTPTAEYMKSQAYKFMGWLPFCRIYIRNDLPELMKRLTSIG